MQPSTSLDRTEFCQRHVRNLVGGFLEEIALREIEYPGNNIARHRFGHRIEVSYGAVVITARELKVVLGLNELILQVQEILVRFKIRIVFGERNQSSDFRAELFFGFAARGDVCLTHGFGTQLRDRLQRGTLVLGVLIDGCYQAGHEIMAALQLDVDVAPRSIDAIAAANQAVVDDDAGDKDQRKDEQDDVDFSVPRSLLVEEREEHLEDVGVK